MRLLVAAGLCIPYADIYSAGLSDEATLAGKHKYSSVAMVAGRYCIITQHFYTNLVSGHTIGQQIRYKLTQEAKYGELRSKRGY